MDIGHHAVKMAFIADKAVPVFAHPKPLPERVEPQLGLAHHGHRPVYDFHDWIVLDSFSMGRINTCT